MAGVQSGRLAQAAMILAILLVAAAFIVATPTTGDHRGSDGGVHGTVLSAAGAHCAPIRPIWKLPARSKWRRNGWGSPLNQALSRRISADQPYLRSRHVILAQWGPDTTTGRIAIFLVHYSARAAGILYAQYGCGIVVSHISEPLPVTR
jgi:hypothetical protein